MKWSGIMNTNESLTRFRGLVEQRAPRNIKSTEVIYMEYEDEPFMKKIFHAVDKENDNKGLRTNAIILLCIKIVLEIDSLNDFKDYFSEIKSNESDFKSDLKVWKKIAEFWYGDGVLEEDALNSICDVLKRDKCLWCKWDLSSVYAYSNLERKYTKEQINDFLLKIAEGYKGLDEKRITQKSLEKFNGASVFKITGIEKPTKNNDNGNKVWQPIPYNGREYLVYKK